MSKRTHVAVVVAILCVACLPTGAAERDEMKKRKEGQMIDRRVSPPQGAALDNLYANNPQVVRTDKEVVLVFGVQRIDEVRASGVHQHYQPAATTHWAVSRDGGMTWTITSEAPRVGRVLDATYGVPLREGGMATITFLRPSEPIYALIQGDRIGWRPYCADLPRIEAFPVTDLGGFDTVGFHAMTRTSDGALLAGAYGRTKGKEEPFHNATFFLRSEDEGRTWRFAACLSNPPEFWLVEPSLLAGPNGRVLTVLRASTPPGGVDVNPFYHAESKDNGRTWSTPVATPVYGHPAHLVRLSSGTVLMVYGYRRKPHSVRAILSRDDGRTWDKNTMRTLHTFTPGYYDLGYPQATQLDDGAILCAYYGYTTKSHGRLSPCGIFVSLFDEKWLAEAGQ
jgi:hypothetical protein